MAEWQDISTAPVDGTTFLAIEECGDSDDGYDDADGGLKIWLTGYWHDGCSEFHYGTADESHFDADYSPTHWMPLPEPPA